MSNTIEVVIESPKGSKQKYDFEPNSGAFKLKKLLPKGMVFPYDFGFIPKTLGEDGDPLDVVVISEAATFTGCRLDCRIIGSLVAEQTERDGTKVRNDRYIAIPEISKDYAPVKRLSDLPKGLIEELETFFTTYNTLAGKKFKVIKKIGTTSARKEIDLAREPNQVTMRLELILPHEDNEGNRFDPKLHNKIQNELIEEFGGLTTYERLVQGSWKSGRECMQQSVIVHELLLPSIDFAYWQKMKNKLEKTFKQTEVMLVYGSIYKV